MSEYIPETCTVEKPFLLVLQVYVTNKPLIYYFVKKIHIEVSKGMSGFTK
jgi:hypothetical protein